MRFHEIQTIQCPDRQSFDEHLEIWEDIELVAKTHNVEFDWEVLDRKERTFRLDVKGSSKKNHMNGLIAVMKFLSEQNIKPALIVTSEDLRNTKKNIKKAIEICEEVA